MAEIVLARIDDRLIHGQVMTAWVQYTGANHIIIVDDQTAADDFVRSVITMAVPRGIGLDILSVKDGADYLKKVKENKKIIILAKVPETFLALIEDDVDIKEVIIGGMGASKVRHKFYKNISVTEQERETFRKIVSHHVKLRIQVIPDERSVSVDKLL